MNDEYALLRQLVFNIHPITTDWDAFSAIWHPYSADRRQVITQSGTTEKWLYFVLEGVQRVYYFDDQGREATLVFSYSPSFGGVLDSFLLQKPSPYYFEALTASRFLRASFLEIEALMLKSPEVNTMIRKGVSVALAGLLERLVELQSFSNEEKFRKLLTRSPHILQLVPHKYLANYLGMDPTNFSKLMNRVRVGNE